MLGSPENHDKYIFFGKYWNFRNDNWLTLTNSTNFIDHTTCYPNQFFFFHREMSICQEKGLDMHLAEHLNFNFK